MASRQGLSSEDVEPGLQVPAGSFNARCLLSPRGVQSVPVVVASRPVMASPNSAGWPLPFKCNEAEPSSRDATARAFASPSFCEQRRRHSLWVWLHDFRPIIMINAFQLTRTNQACLALSEFARIPTQRPLRTELTWHSLNNHFGGQRSVKTRIA